MAEASFFGSLFGRRNLPEAKAGHAFSSLVAPCKGYVFVVSYGQSGDLLVQNLLNAASGVVVRGENGNLLRPLATAWHHAERNALAAFAAYENESARQFEDLTLLGWHLANSFVRDALRLPQGTQMGGFREIRFHGNAHAFKQQMDFMATFFPTARFVFNTRDVTQVARTGWWREQDPAKVAKTLDEANALFERYMMLNPDHCLHLHYDIYSANPSELGVLFDWLGLHAPGKDKIETIVRTHCAALDAETKL